MRKPFHLSFSPVGEHKCMRIMRGGMAHGNNHKTFGQLNSSNMKKVINLHMGRLKDFYLIRTKSRFKSIQRKNCLGDDVVI